MRSFRQATEGKEGSLNSPDVCGVYERVCTFSHPYGHVVGQRLGEASWALD